MGSMCICKSKVCKSMYLFIYLLNSMKILVLYISNEILSIYNSKTMKGLKRKVKKIKIFRWRE